MGNILDQLDLRRLWLGQYEDQEIQDNFDYGCEEADEIHKDY